MKYAQRPDRLMVAQIHPRPVSLLPLLGAYAIFIAVFWYLVIASPTLGLGLAGPSTLPIRHLATSLSAHPSEVTLSSLVLGPQMAKPSQVASGRAPSKSSALQASSAAGSQ